MLDTTPSKVVVVIIIVIICTLSLYLAFMLILNPFLASRGLRSANMPAPATSFSPSKSVRTFRGHVAQREHDFKNFAGKPRFNPTLLQLLSLNLIEFLFRTRRWR